MQWVTFCLFYHLAWQTVSASGSPYPNWQEDALCRAKVAGLPLWQLKLHRHLHQYSVPDKLRKYKQKEKYFGLSKERSTTLLVFLGGALFLSWQIESIFKFYLISCTNCHWPSVVCDSIFCSGLYQGPGTTRVIDQLSSTCSSECLCIKLMVQQSSQSDKQVIYLQSGKRTDNFIVLIVHFSCADALAHSDLCASIRA